MNDSINHTVISLVHGNGTERRSLNSTANFLSKVSDFNVENEHVPNNGSGYAEIFGLMLVEPSISLIMSMLYYLCLSLDFRLLTSLLPSSVESKISWLVHATVVNVIFLLVATVWSDYLFIVLMALVCAFVSLAYVGWKRKNSVVQQTKLGSFSLSKFLSMEVLCRKDNLPYLDDFRGHLLHMTAISILAVDFAIFPVRYAKTENYGWSVMDVGVGLFVGAHGICSSQARGKTHASLKRSISSCIPLLAVGFLRLAAVTAVDYHKVISEYGVHWNFFFTLALTKMMCSIISICLPNVDSCWLAIVLGSFHQWLLSYNGMTQYIQQEDRYNLIDANKEGICSLLGFIAIYFGSIKIGKLLWKPMSKMKDYIKLLLSLLTLWAIGWLFSYILHQSIQPVSRRMANLPYCIWIISFMCLHISVHLAQHLLLIFYCTLLKPKEEGNSSFATMTSYLLWKATNYNGLFYFLLANILTGFVNLSVDTHSVKPEFSLLVLLAYIAILTLTTTLMFINAIQVKFW